MSRQSTAVEIRAVSFDLDDTLWPVEPVLARAELEMMAWLEANCPRIALQFDIAAMRALRLRIAAEQVHLANDMTGLRKAVIAHVAALTGYDNDIVEPAFAIFLRYRNQVEFYPEVMAVLHALHTRFCLGAISNGNADIHKVGLGEIMRFAISASEFGKAKPHPETFLAAAAAANIEPAQMVHVGDDPHTDVAGAAAVGVRTVWINRTGTPWPAQRYPDVVPDAEIRTLDELPATLQWLEEP